MNILLTPRSSWHLPAAVLLGVALLGTGSLRAQTSQFTFTNLADTNTAAPGEGSNFSGFYTPSLSNGVVVVTGLYNGNGGVGVFTASAASGVSTIIDSSASPAGHGTFTNFNSPTISGGNIAFAATYNAGTTGTAGTGLYALSTGNPGVAITLVDRGQTTPNGTATFTTTYTPVISGNNYVFLANTSGSGIGVYQGTLGSATITTLSDKTSPAPGQNGATFTTFNQFPTISGSTSAFYGRSNNAATGIYSSNPLTGLHVVANTSTPVPGHAGETFSNFSGTGVVSGSSVAFHGGFADGQGYYVGSASGTGGLTTIVELNQLAPRGGTFTGFGVSPAFSGGNVLFDATTTNNGTSTSGLFLNSGGSLSEVIGVGDAFLGSTLSYYTFSPTAFDGNQFTFQYDLANGNEGIALVTVVPEPATWVVGAELAGLTALAWGRRRWRRTA